MGVYPDGGLESRFFQICFGPKIVPKSPFGVGMGPFGPKNHKESESGLKKPKFFEKIQNFEKKFFRKNSKITPPFRKPPIGAFLIEGM